MKSKITFVIALFIGTFSQAQTPETGLYQFWEQKIPDLWKQYTQLTPIDSNYAIFSRYNEQGVRHRSGTVTISGMDGLTISCQNRLVAFKNGRVAIMHPDGRTIIPFQNGICAACYDCEKFIFSEQPGTTVYDSTGRLVQLPGKTIQDMPQKGYYVASDDLGRMGLTDLQGNWIVGPDTAISNIYYLQYGYWVVNKGNVRQLFHPQRKWTGSKKFNDIFTISADSLGFWGKLSPKDTLARYYYFDETPGNSQLAVSSIFDGHAPDYLVILGQKYSIWDQNLRPLLPTTFDYISAIYFNNTTTGPKYYMVSNSNKTGLWADKKWILPLKFTNIETYGSNIVAYTPDSAFVFDQNAHLLIGIGASNAFLFDGFLNHDNLRDSVYHLQKGWLKLPRGTTMVNSNLNYLLLRNDKGEESIADMNGKIVVANIESIYNVLNVNQLNYLVVYQKEGLLGWYMPMTGQVNAPQYNDIQFMPDGKLLVQKNLRWGIIDADGRSLAPIHFDDARFTINNPFVFLKKNNKWQIYTLDGKLYRTTSFDDIAQLPLNKGNHLIYWGKTDNNWQLYNTKSDKGLLPFTLPELQDIPPTYGLPFDNIVLRHSKTGKYGCLDYEGNILTPFEWDTLGTNWGRKGTMLTLFKPGTLEAHSTLEGQSVTTTNNFYSIVTLPGQRFRILDQKEKNIGTRDFITVVPVLAFLKNRQVYCFIVQNDPQKWAILTEQGNTQTQFKCDTLYHYSDMWFGYKKGDKKYLYNVETDKSVRWEYDNISTYGHPDYYYVTRAGLHGLLNKALKEVVPCQYQQLYSYQQQFSFVADADGRTGIITHKGKICIPLDYYDVPPYPLNESVFMAKKNQQVGVYSVAEDKWTPASYEDIQSCNVRIPLAQSLFLIRVKGKYGIMDTDCREVIAPKYDRIDADNYQLLHLINGNQTTLFDPVSLKTLGEPFDQVQTNGEYTLAQRGAMWTIFKQNKPTATRQCADMELLLNDIFRFRVTRQSPWGLLRADGSVVMEPRFDAISTELSVIVTNKNGAIQLWDATGAPLVNDIFTQYLFLNYRYIQVQKDGLWGLYNQYGQIVLPVRYESIKPSVNNDHFVVGKDGKFSFVFKGGVPMFNGQWEAADEFSNGMAAVKEGGKWGYIRPDGTYSITPQYQFADRFQGYQERFAAVRQQGEVFLIDATGQRLQRKWQDSYYFILPPFDSTCAAFRETPFIISSPLEQLFSDFVVVDAVTGLRGVVDLNGRWVIRPMYTFISSGYTDRTVFFVQKEGKYGIFSKKDNYLTPLDFDEIYEDEGGKYRVKKDKKSFWVNRFGEIIP